MRRSIHTPLRSASTPRFSRSFVGRTTNPNVIVRPTVLSRTLLTSTSSTSTSSAWKASTLFTGLALASGLTATVIFSDESKVDYDKIRQEIKDLLENENYDDGSYGPVLVRLAWHASGTYSRTDKNGGSNGATMRYKSEASDGANAGLDVARNLLEKIKQKYPGISYADLWTLAGSVAIEELGGPKIDWVPGRTDADSEKACPPQGRLPDAAQGASHVRDVFYRMGFNDREITALIGAHALGRCHTDRSGFDGPWTSAPTAFTNEFYIQLMENKWTVKDWKGPKQYEDSSKTLMMLPADMAFLWDEEFKKYVKLYADDEDLWFEDFAKAWKKLIELGTPMESKSWWQKIFG